jgi:hypothetical protein
LVKLPPHLTNWLLAFCVFLLNLNSIYSQVEVLKSITTNAGVSGMLVENNNIHLVSSSSNNFLGIELTVNKLDLNTNNIQSKTLSNIKTASVCTNCQLANIVKDNNGNIIVFGEELYSQNLIWTKLDNNYNVIWSKTLLPTSNFNFSDIKFSQVIRTSDGGYAATGTLTTPFFNVPKNIWLLKLDSNGDISWFKSYNIAGSVLGSSIATIVTGLHLKEMPNGDLLAIGRTPVMGSGMYIMRTNTNGVMQWMSHYNISGYDFPLDSYILPNGNVWVIVNNFIVEIIPYPTASYSGGEIVSIKKVIGTGNNYLFLNGIEPLSDGNFLLHGSYFYDQNRTQFEKGLILKITPSLSILWSRVYEDSWYLSKVKQHNNSIYISGFEFSNSLNTLIGKLDLDGKINNCYNNEYLSIINSEDFIFEDGVPDQYILSGVQGFFSPQENSIYEQQIKCCYIPTPTITATNGSNSCYTTGTYSISNSYTGAVINWSVSPNIPGIIISGQGTTNLQLDLSLLSNQGAIVSVNVSYSGACSESASFEIKECCIPSGLPPSTVYWNNTVASAINPADNPIVINGVFIVNQNLTLINKQIYLGPDAKIDITSGNFLSLRNCTLQAGCNYMWDGIYASYGNSSVNISQNSVFKDAQNAIVSRNGGHFLISSSTFDKNYKHIVAENYNAQHTASIVSSQLLCSGGNSLIAPHVGKRTHKAIEINNVRQITIGDASISTNQNIFDNANYGIYSTESGISVYNNRFQNITLLQGQAKQECMPGTAICSFGTDDYLVKPEITFLVNIGGNADNEFNYFQNTGYGVDAHLSQTISIIGNNFQQIGANAVEVIDNNARNTQIVGNVINNAASNGIVLARNQTLSNVLVTNNIISNVQLSGISYAGGNFSNCNIEQNTLRLCKRGIYTYQNKVGTKIFVQGNNISYQPIWGNPNQFSSGEGILLSETNFGNGVYYYVFNNTVSRYAKGINAKNVSNGSEIRQNNLRLAAYMPVNQLQEGIYLENCQKVTVISNTIQPLSGSMSNYTNAGGIWAQKSPACFISCNVNDMIGYGVKCSGPMPSATVYNNKLKNNGRGIWLANAALIGPQGDILNPTYNEWTGNFAAKMYTSNFTFGTQSPFWVKNSPPKFNPSNSNFSDIPGFEININTTTQGSNIAPACPVILIGGPKLRHAIALDTMQYADMQEKWMLKHSLYREIVTDTALLADTVLQQYKDSISYTNIGIIDNVKSSLNDSLTYNNSSALLSASNLNNALQPQNTIEQLNKELAALQINLRLQNRDSLSQAEIDYLRNIALLCPYKDGDAVFEARALLTWYDSIGTRYINPCEGIYVASNRMAENENTDTENNYYLSKDVKEALITLYPNPANNYVDIVNITTLSYLQIYAHNGTLVLSKEISGNKETERIEIGNLPTGLYVYIINNNNQEPLAKGKLSIIK